MNGPNWHSLDQAIRNIIPICLTFLLLVLSVIPTGIPYYSEITPVLPIIAIYHWAIYKPDLLPTWSVFILGCVYDLLSGTPLGLYALVFLSVYGIVIFQRRFLYGKSFLVCWLGFGVVALGAAIESWVVASIWYFSLLNATSVFFQYFLSLGMFPIVAWVALQLQQHLLEQDENAPRS